MSEYAIENKRSTGETLFIAKEQKLATIVKPERDILTEEINGEDNQQVSEN